LTTRDSSTSRDNCQPASKQASFRSSPSSHYRTTRPHRELPRAKPNKRLPEIFRANLLRRDDSKTPSPTSANHPPPKQHCRDGLDGIAQVLRRGLRQGRRHAAVPDVPEAGEPGQLLLLAGVLQAELGASPPSADELFATVRRARGGRGGQDIGGCMCVCADGDARPQASHKKVHKKTSSMLQWCSCCWVRRC
jgi:hypothetical protein